MLGRGAKITARFARLCVPSGIRDALRIRRLRRRYGLTLVRSGVPQVIVESSFGNVCRIGSNVVILHSCIGDYSYVETGCRIAYAQIGRFCSIAPGATIGLEAHPVRDYVSTHPIFYLRAPGVGYDFVDHSKRSDYQHTIVGHDVWIGANALIMDGISVGHGAVIGAGAVVTRDVPPYAIVGGVPAKLIRYRFDGEIIERLLAVRWWDRPAEWIRQHVVEFADIHTFLHVCDEDGRCAAFGVERADNVERNRGADELS